MYKVGRLTESESLFEAEVNKRFTELQDRNLIGGRDVSNEYLSYISRLSVREEIIELSIAETNPHPRHMNNDITCLSSETSNA